MNSLHQPALPLVPERQRLVCAEHMLSSMTLKKKIVLDQYHTNFCARRCKANNYVFGLIAIYKRDNLGPKEAV